MDNKEMKPMSILTESSKSSSSENEVSLRQRRSGGVLIVIVTSIFVIFFILAYMSNPVNNNQVDSYEYNVIERPNNIKTLLDTVTERGLNTRSLIPIKKSDSQIITQSNLPFIVSYMKEARLRSRAKPSNGVVIDPFDSETMDMNLFVTHVAPMHTLVLNKFPSFPNHAILTTNKFQKQSSTLTFEDLDAWYWSLNEVNGFGIYNSDPLAGSSQPHKHVQLIPRESLQMKFEYISENLYYRVSTESKTIEPDIFLPIENEIFQHLTSNSNIPQWSSYDPLHSVPIIHQIEQYKFIHGILILMSQDEWKTNQVTSSVHHSYAEYLLTGYHQLLEYVNLATREELQGKSSVVIDASYNLLLTQRWMMIIPRSKGNYQGRVAVNGFGFYGLLLFSNETSLTYVKENEGFSAVLKGVSIPLE